MSDAQALVEQNLINRAQAAEAEVARLREEKDLIFARMDYATDEHAKLMVENADLKAEVARLNKLCEQVWKQMDDAFTHSLMDNMAQVELEAQINRLREALEGLRNVSYRLPGCPDPECIPCLENSRALDAAREALAATPEQSLARVRNEVLEEAANTYEKMGEKMYAAAIRALKAGKVK